MHCVSLLHTRMCRSESIHCVHELEMSHLATIYAPGSRKHQFTVIHRLAVMKHTQVYTLKTTILVVNVQCTYNVCILAMSCLSN